MLHIIISRMNLFNTNGLGGCITKLKNKGLCGGREKLQLKELWKMFTDWDNFKIQNPIFGCTFPVGRSKDNFCRCRPSCENKYERINGARSGRGSLRLHTFLRQ